MLLKREPFFKNWKSFIYVSYGIVYIFFNLWVIYHLSNFVPPGQERMWEKVLMAYLLLNIVVLGSADLRNKLFDVRFIDFLPRFIIYSVIFLGLWYLVLVKVYDPLGPSSFSLIANVPLWLAAIHGLTFATIESVIWQGYLDEKIGRPASAITAGIFHVYIWTGTPLIVIFSAGLLFLIFSFVHWRFRQSKKDFAPVIACHFAFNVIKIGLAIAGVV